MKVVRKNIFETNSSSTHSITMCSDEEYKKWINGETYWNGWENIFKSLSDVMAEFKSDTEIECLNDKDELRYRLSENGWFSYDAFNNYDCMRHETFDTEYTTASGETVHAFGYYGYD